MSNSLRITLIFIALISIALGLINSHYLDDVRPIILIAGIILAVYAWIDLGRSWKDIKRRRRELNGDK